MSNTMPAPPLTSPKRFQGTHQQMIMADTWGVPDGRPILFLHGGGQTRHAWNATAQALALKGLYAITLDARGHGESDWAPGGDYRLESFANDVLAVVQALGMPSVLVGASLGGLTALLLEGEIAPGTAMAVVLVDIVPRLEVVGTTRILDFMTRHPDGFATLEEAATAIAQYLPRRERPADATTGLGKVLREQPDGRWRWHWDPAFLSNGTLRAVADVDRLRACARRLRCPTLLVRGRMSDVVSIEGARQFLSDCPHAELVDVSDAGHMVVGDRNDAFTSAVLHFLERARLTPDP